jgi:hypothetical protein
MKILYRIPFSVFRHPYVGVWVGGLRLVEAWAIGSLPSA